MSEKRIDKGASITKLVIWSVVALILIALFALMMIGKSVSFVSSGGFTIVTGEFYSDAESYSAGNMTYDETVKNINIHWTDGKVKLVVREGEGIEIVESGAGSRDEHRMRSRVVGDTLDVRFVKSGFRWFSSLPSKELTVYIPPSVAVSLGNIEITSASAEITIGNAEPETETGFDCRSVSIESVSGNVDIYGLRADKLEVKAVSAGVTLEGNIGEITIEGVSGKLFFTGEVNDVDVSTVSSTVRLALDTMPDEVNVETVSGNIELLLPESKSGFEAELNTVSGSMKFDSRSVGEYYKYTNGESELDFETVSGSVNIKIMP